MPSTLLIELHFIMGKKCKLASDDLIGVPDPKLLQVIIANIIIPHFFSQV